MKILVANAGSSSFKYELFDMTDERSLAEGQAERLGKPESRFRHQSGGKKWEWNLPIPDHRAAVEKMLSVLTDVETGPIRSGSEIQAVGHRVVHGGTRHTRPTVIDEQVLKDIRELAMYAPLHNPANAQGIEALQAAFPDVTHVAVFDTAFHHTMPPHAYLYGLDYELAEKYGIRRYGFHGTSHQYVAERAAILLGHSLMTLRLITCHIGNGTSITAVDRGRSVDTSMGMTPLQGVIMGTRSGSLDPFIAEFLMEKENLDFKGINNLLNRKSGLLGLSGLSGDIRDLEKAAREGNRRARLALDVHTHQIKKFIGSYLLVLGGADAIVFTAGVGENSARCRAEVCSGLDFLGTRLDPAKNESLKGEGIISTPDSKVKILVVPTDEELMIARATVSGR
jgi:acetate kinase